MGVRGSDTLGLGTVFSRVIGNAKRVIVVGRRRRYKEFDFLVVIVLGLFWLVSRALGFLLLFILTWLDQAKDVRDRSMGASPTKCETPIERWLVAALRREVLGRSEFQITPQVRVGRYRADIVVERTYPGGRVVYDIECQAVNLVNTRPLSIWQTKPTPGGLFGEGSEAEAR